MTPDHGRSEAAHAEGREFITRILISEGVSVLFALGLLWYLGPGRMLIAGTMHKIKTRMRRRGDYIDSEAARFGAEISRWDHEQTARANHPSSRGGGGCGCDGTPSLRHG